MQTLGKIAEQYACHYLKQQGLILLAENFRCKMGEIDLIMQDKDTLTFIEVRYRNNAAFGNGTESVTFTKQNKIIKTGLFYLQKNRLLEKVACRFDIISLSPNPSSTHNPSLPHFKVEWIKDAFQAEGGYY